MAESSIGSLSDSHPRYPCNPRLRSLCLTLPESEDQPSLRYPSSPWAGYAVASGSAGEDEGRQRFPSASAQGLSLSNGNGQLVTITFRRL